MKPGRVLASVVCLGPAFALWLPAAPPAATPLNFLAAPPTAAPALALNALASRPFFDPSRRPDPVVGQKAAAVAKPVVTPLASAYAVRGVVSGPGGEVVLVERLAGRKTLRLGLGQAIDGRKLVAVEEDSVVFEENGARVGLTRPRPSGG